MTKWTRQQRGPYRLRGYGAGRMKREMVARKIIIGDIHGCNEELADLLQLIGPGQGDMLISVGDIVDRGPDSKKVFNFFRDRENALVIRGNHEHKHLRGALSFSQQLTVRQFGGDYEAARTVMGTFPCYYEDDDLIVVHAALNPAEPMEAQREEVLCGTMGGERYLKALLAGKKWYEEYRRFKPVVFGHHVTGKKPFIYKDKIFGIDTGACHGGWLTALSLPDFKFYSVKSRDNYWSRVNQGPRKRWKENQSNTTG